MVVLGKIDWLRKKRGLPDNTGFLNLICGFKKSICELTKEEIKVLKEDNQIHIYFQSFSYQIEENHRIQEMINVN